MPWINLDDIDLRRFMQGNYIPPNYYAPLSRIDLRYLFPNREYEMAINLMNNETVKQYINGHKDNFLVPDAIDINQWELEKSAYMPGPGNRRPTNSIMRFLVKGEPSFAYVAKVGNYLAGREEFEKQNKLYTLGFPTPRPFFWENGAFINFFKGLSNFLNAKFMNRTISQEDYNKALKVFNGIVKEEEEFYTIKNKLNETLFMNSSGDYEEVELLLEYYRGKKLQFASILWMEFKFSVSFECLLYNLLGGLDLDQQTGTFEILPPYETTIVPYNILVKVVPALLNKLWEITTHNDLKGEHIRLDTTNNKNQFIMIDWGTGGGGTIEFIPRDLGILLYDVTSFIIERALFSRKFKHKLEDPRALALEKQILSTLEDFWYHFLNHLEPKYLTSDIISHILKIFEPHQDIYVQDAIHALKRIESK